MTISISLHQKIQEFLEKNNKKIVYEFFRYRTHAKRRPRPYVIRGTTKWLARHGQGLDLPRATKSTGDLACRFACDGDSSVGSMQTTTGKYGGVAKSCPAAVDTTFRRNLGTSPPWVLGENPSAQSFSGLSEYTHCL